jgi:hypothetical protein
LLQASGLVWDSEGLIYFQKENCVISDREALCSQILFLHQVILYTNFPPFNTLKLNGPSSGFLSHLFVCKGGSYRENSTQLALNCYFSSRQMPCKLSQTANEAQSCLVSSSGSKEMLLFSCFMNSEFVVSLRG